MLLLLCHYDALASRRIRSVGLWQMVRAGSTPLARVRKTDENSNSQKFLIYEAREPMPVSYDRITTTIEREWLAQIIAGTKKIEYRQIKPYWTKRFGQVSLPFELRLLNGMNPPVPEVTVLIHKITKDRRAGEYQLQP